MKKALLIAMTVVLLGWGLGAADLDLGLFVGTRSVNDEQIQEVYGGGMAVFPYAAVGIWKGLFAGAGYEFGYSREGKIGLYQEDATLKVTGFEAFAGYRLEAGKFAPYVKLGLGSYAYSQTVAGVKQVDGNKVAVTIAGGAKYRPAKGWYVAAEIKYVPLKVMPEDISVDLGGLRLAVGGGYTFNL